MQQRWEGYLSKAEEEAPRIMEQAAQAPSVKEQGQRAKDKAQGSMQDEESPAGTYGGSTSYDQAGSNQRC